MLEGLPPNDAAQLLRFTCDETRARAAADFVMEVFDPAETAAASFEDESSDVEPRPWIVEIYFGRGVDEARIRALIADTMGEELAATVVTEAIAQQDWVQRSLTGLAPVRAGRFLVHGRHDRDAVRPNDLALEIEAALAFGTGHHGTTRGCLLALDAVLKRRRPRRVVDLGTGTGVLAMAAAKALRTEIFCGDLDPVAVASARTNAVLNGVAPHIRPVVAAGLQHLKLKRNAPYDLILANILARPLEDARPEHRRACGARRRSRPVGAVAARRARDPVQLRRPGLRAGAAGRTRRLGDPHPEEALRRLSDRSGPGV